jgi:hypothetical protein
MAQQLDTVQRVMQIPEQPIDLRSHSDTASSAEEIVNHRVMARRDFFPRDFVTSITFFRQSRTVEKLMGHTLKCGDYYNERLSARRFQDNRADISDATGGGKRRPAELKDSHGVKLI